MVSNKLDALTKFLAKKGGEGALRYVRQRGEIFPPATLVRPWLHPDRRFPLSSPGLHAGFAQTRTCL